MGESGRATQLAQLIVLLAINCLPFTGTLSVEIRATTDVHDTLHK